MEEGWDSAGAAGGRGRRESMFFFFFNVTAATEIYTLSLHDALPISTAARNVSAAIGPTPGIAMKRRHIASWLAACFTRLSNSR